MDFELLRRLNVERAARRAVVLVTDLGGGPARLLLRDAMPDDALGDAVEAALRTGASGTVENGGRTFFINVHVPAPRLVIVGAVHISQALTPMARAAGFEPHIIDPRTAFATPERFANVVLHADWPETVLSENPLDGYTALAALTHDPKIDDFALKAALDANCFYVGALGSRKTHASRVERLLAQGATPDQIGRIRAPIGLDIGASSPAEIAVSVLAEIIAALRARRRTAEKEKAA